MAYSYITWGQLKSALLLRLQDQHTSYATSTGEGFVTAAEAGVYLTEALRTLNAQVAIWNADYSITFQQPGWLSLTGAGSPRERTVTDDELYQVMEYHLLEPPSGSVWTGTTQFNIAALAQALKYRRDELLQVSGANVTSLQIPAPTGGTRTTLPDTILNLRRVRWVPAVGQGYSPYAVWREDSPSVQAYGDRACITTAEPESWLITADAPLQFDCSSIPPVPAQWDLLALESGADLTPPAATVLGLPNDWCWVAKWGALADLLANSPEGSDQQRAKYCIQRFEAGKKAMLALPWLVTAYVESLPVDTVSYEEADAYAQNWEQTWPAGDPQIVVGGVDLVALCPNVTAPNVMGSVLTVVGNAPIPTADNQNVQLSRDAVDAVLAYAQHLAMFKCGGAEFAATMPLYAQFDRYCASENARYAALGITRQSMIHEGTQGEDFDPRYQSPAEVSADA